MLTRATRIRVLTFIVIGLLAVAFIAVRYVGLLRLFGVGVYTVHLELPSTGGIFPNAEVDYRGVPVGRVSDVRLTATGVQADLQLESSAAKIPVGVRAVVANLSVIGEQYVDLRPRTSNGPYLGDGSTITNSGIPPTANALLNSSDALLRSIPVGSLQTTIRELDRAFSGSSNNLRRLLTTSNAFFTAADKNFPQTTVLLDSSATVLRTQQQVSSSIRSFSRNLRLLSAQLRSSDPDLRALLRVTPSAALSAQKLIDDVGTPLGVTLSNLTTTSQVFLANVNGVQQLLVQVPTAVGIGSKVVTPQGANVGLTLNFFNPLPCTDGYLGTPRRGGLDTSPGQPLNTSAGCVSTSSGTDVRGSQHVPSETGVSDEWLDGYLSAPGRSVHSLDALFGASQ